MNKKISVGMVCGLIIISILASSAITVSFTKSQYNNILKGLPEKLDRYEVLDEIDDVIRKNYYISNVENSIDTAMAQGYINGLSDNFSTYFTAEKFVRYKSQTQGDMQGIGVEIDTSSKNKIVITEVHDGSPANDSGLKANDAIVAFDGIKIDSLNYTDMLDKLESDKLTSVNLTYKRGEDEHTIDVLKGYKAQSVSSQTYNKIGYIKITNFYSSTAGELKTIVDMFVSSGLNGLVLDLRKNASPNFQYAIDALDVFVPMTDYSDPAASVLNGNNEVIASFETTAGEVSLPTIILVSKNTKSAAELFSCNMRDFGKAEILGSENTAGFGLMQEIFQLSSGDAVLLSTGLIKPFKSDNYNGVGISPDYVVELDKATTKIESDSQFLSAASVLSPQ